MGNLKPKLLYLTVNFFYSNKARSLILRSFSHIIRAAVCKDEDPLGRDIIYKADIGCVMINWPFRTQNIYFNFIYKI